MYERSYLLSVLLGNCLCIIYAPFISRIFLYMKANVLSNVTDIIYSEVTLYAIASVGKVFSLSAGPRMRS